MNALVVDHAAPGRLALHEVDDPVPGPDEVIIGVEAISLNHGELPREGADEGVVPGWDAAGIVLAEAADGTGPAAGSRVVSRNARGGWAQLRTAQVGNIAVLPDSVSFEHAAVLPVAAVTALEALRAAGAILGRRVLVTGASGGVGRFAVQLAHLGGAHVVALAGSEARAAGLRELGADEVVYSLAELDRPLDAVIENVGGEVLVGAFGLLEPGGVAVSIGSASRAPALFPPYATVGGGRRLVAFSMAPTSGEDLAYLVALLAEARLNPEIGFLADWERAGEAAELLLARKIQGKAVLRVR